MKSTSLAALLAVAGVTLSGLTAQAADLGGNCCADLEERIAELEATTARKGNRKVSLTVSGWVNEAVMFWDDGRESNAYQVTNETARTRFRFLGSAKIDASWTAGYLLEIGVRGANQSAVSQNNDDAGAGLDLRHSAWWLQNKDLGKLWVGQTSQASDGITEINLATGVGSTVNSSPEFTNHIGGFFLRNTNGTLSGITVSNITNGFPNPGEGFRHNVVKYETPTIAGFVGSASWGEDDVWDVALRYAGEFSGVKVAAGIAYTQWTDGTSTVAGTNSPERNCVRTGAAGNNGTDVSCEELGLSASVMHVPTGLFLSGAYGYKKDDNRAILLPGSKSRDEFYYLVGGIEQKFNPLGKTTVYGEYYEGRFGPAISAPTTIGTNSTVRSAATLGLTGNIQSSDVSFWGIGFNQNIEAAAMDLYVSFRNYDFSVTSTTGGKSSLEDMQTVVTGARIQF